MYFCSVITKIRLLLLLLPISMGLKISGNPIAKDKYPSAPPSGWVLMEPDRVPHRAPTDKNLQESVPMDVASIARYINAEHRDGIDVSHYQGRIDWKRVAREAKVSYAYIKCSEGATIQDEYYTRNIREARQNGLMVGAYHFYRPASSPEDQLANMTAIAKVGEMDLVPIIDIEQRGNESQERFIAKLTKFIIAVEKHYGKRPMLYTGQNFYNKNLAGAFSNYTWMIAKYIEEPPILTDNLDYSFWQYTSKARVPGINGNVDKSCIMEGHHLQEIALQ